jgi:dual specificity protein phosphatase-like protein
VRGGDVVVDVGLQLCNAHWFPLNFFSNNSSNSTHSRAHVLKYSPQLLPLSTTQPFHFHSLDIFLTAGPLNLAQLYKFVMHMNSLLEDKSLATTKLYFYSRPDAASRANAAYLIGGYAVLYLVRDAEQQFAVQCSVVP